MTSRDKILGSIRRQLPQSVELPPETGNWIHYPDPLAQFTQVLESVGGQCLVVDRLADIPPLLGEPTGIGKRIVSLIPGVLPEITPISGTDDPHSFADVELAILPGQLAVAENGAVWVTDEHVPQRILYFLGQHLALVVPADQLVPHLHAAYERLDIGRTRFGAFISGPSKTADIEQSLVMGAHGARTLKVFLVRELNQHATSGESPS